MIFNSSCHSYIEKIYNKWSGSSSTLLSLDNFHDKKHSYKEDIMLVFWNKLRKVPFNRLMKFMYIFVLFIFYFGFLIMFPIGLYIITSIFVKSKIHCNEKFLLSNESLFLFCRSILNILSDISHGPFYQTSVKSV